MRPDAYDVVFYCPRVTALLAPTTDRPGGAETQVYMLARAVAARGYRVCLIALPADGLPERVDGVDIAVHPPPAAGRGPAARLRAFAAPARTVSKVRGQVVVQRGAGRVTGVVALAARARRRRFVYSAASVMDFDFAAIEPQRRNVALFELGLKLADRVVVQTAEQEALCRERLGLTSTLIRSLAEDAEPRSSADTFLWVGRLSPYRRPVLMVELARALPQARFTMVAVANVADARELGAEVRRAAEGVPNLEILDAMERPRLMALFGRAVAVINTTEFEGMSNIFLEAWARGVPALTLSHDADGILERERLGANAHGSFDGLVALAREMWESREDQRQLSARCRDYVRREHSVDAVTDRWIEALGLSDPPRGTRRRA